MQAENLWRKFDTLPPAVQKQVSDYIEFLESRYGKRKKNAPARKTKLHDEEFIGMWQDREDMQDSTQWVRELRQNEWNK